MNARKLAPIQALAAVTVTSAMLASTHAATVVRVEMAAAAPVSTPTFTSTSISPRSSVAAPPVTATPGFITTAEPGPAVESTRSVEGDAPAAGTTSAADDAPAAAPSRPRRGRRSATVAPTPAPSAPKGGMAPAVVFDDPTALRISAEAGWASAHTWRGVDLVQFTSFNHIVPGTGAGGTGTLKKADSDIYWLGVTATVKGFGLGLKYVESLDDNLNPYYALLLTDKDSYSEMVFTASYTAELVPEWLIGTFGFDFLYYPNGEFWGVDHQGLAYAKFSMPRYTWAQPFVDVFYNVATTEDGNGFAASAVPLGGRAATGSDLVEGWGIQFGVAGGDVIAQTGNVTWGLGYSVSGIYKHAYAFEDDGLSHLVLSLSAPVTIGDSFTITPSVSYTEALADISLRPGPGTNNLATAWNEPGWVASVKASWAF
jgi:hypothetical protein